MQVEVRFRPFRPSRSHPSPAHPSGRGPSGASGSSLRVPEGTNLLEAARRAGLPVASSCGADGVCGRCAVQVLGGAEALSAELEQETHVKQANRVDPDLRLACRAEVHGRVEVTASYW